MATKKSAKKRAKGKLNLPCGTTTLDSHLAAIKSLHDVGLAAGAPTGACLVADPQTGQSRCILTTSSACAAMHGVFIDGPCGGGI